jgi:cytoskeletal protein RodZ
VFQIGDSLREARTRRGYSPADVHKAIRIRERYLTALEEERWDMLPGEAYTKGFLRTYSDYLGLDSRLYIDEYNARVARHDEEPPPLVPHVTAVAGRHGTGRGIVLALAAVAVIGAAVAGLVAWRLSGSSTTAPRSTPPAAAATTPSAKAHTPKPKPTPTTTAVATGPVRTVIAASDRCWILVRDGGPNGTVVFEGTLEPGEAKHFQFTSRLWLRMGRPDVLDITIGGKPIATTLPSGPANLLLTRTGAQPA